MVNTVVAELLGIWGGEDQSFTIETFFPPSQDPQEIFGPSPTDEPYLPLWSISRKRTLLLFGDANAKGWYLCTRGL